MPGWNPAVTKAIEMLQDLRIAVCISPTRLISPMDIDVALGPLMFIDKHGKGALPDFEAFAPSTEFTVGLLRVMWTIQHLAKGHYDVWRCYFATLSMVLQLVFARNEAAFLKYGQLSSDSDGLQAYQQYVVSFDAAVADICRAQNTEHWPDVRDCGIQFVSQQLFSHILAQSFSGLDYATFTKGMQRDAGSIYLALTYQELDSHRILVASPKTRAVTMLGIAEGITRPFDGVRTQATFAMHLVANWNGHISAGLVASLSIAQIHALRSPLRVWPEAKTFCHYCSRIFDAEHPRRTCKGCRRALYCDESCQRQDWKPFHKIVCKMWRLVAERESFRRVRAQIKQLPLDPVKHFPA